MARAPAQAAAAFTDRPGYLADALLTGTAPAAGPVPEASWTAPGVLLGLLSALLAAAVRHHRAAVLPLRRLHSGLLGDYVAWLTFGPAALVLALAAQL
ncbi:hypothetical protein [Kitasatospora sp. NPDC008115]|uniref:hypothetical protein n=1 Tax=Kitasatospora sp. NPDC008115 TaxID=3364022 RepID=UPI0036F0469E